MFDKNIFGFVFNDNSLLNDAGFVRCKMTHFINIYDKNMTTHALARVLACLYENEIYVYVDYIRK